MGKPTGFLEYQRKDAKSLSPENRIRNFDEFHPPLNVADRQKQGARCMNCGVPFCQSALQLKGMVTGCPLHNFIPEWNDDIYNGHFEQAVSRLLKTSSFPEFTGRVCPSLCEKACLCGKDGDPVTIHDNELFLIETAFENGYMKPRVPAVRTGKKVAVIGSGPAGLAAADMLNRRGHHVTVYERDDRPGGLLMYGIPNMKLDKAVIERRIRLMEAEGVRFVTNADVGKSIPAEYILKEYDAVALCCGAKKARDLAVGNRNVQGVHFAVDFLSSTTKSLLNGGLKDGTYISAKDKHVIIVGGGDTGNDCVGTSIRHGCKSVTQIEMMPKAPDDRADDNPWPEWPQVCKTDYGQEEAIAVFGSDPRIYETTIAELISENGVLVGVKTVKLAAETVDGTNRMVPVPGSEQILKADLLIIAAGFVGCENYTADSFGVALTPRNVVKTSGGSYKTEADKVFSAGDMRRGQSLVVWAIVEGRACAHEIDCFLMGYSNII